ncbi:MAG: DUF6122 family protein [Bacteroidota bacterium]
MLHITSHFIGPLLVALVLFGPRWRAPYVLLIATMAVDADHLLADPIYDPARCSIGYHPLHTPSAIVAYVVLAVVGLLMTRQATSVRMERAGRWGGLVGLGLLIHMALDAADCVW